MQSDSLKVIPPCLTVDVLAADVLNKEDKHDTRRKEYHMNNLDMIDIFISSAQALGWKLQCGLWSCMYMGRRPSIIWPLWDGRWCGLMWMERERWRDMLSFVWVLYQEVSLYMWMKPQIALRGILSREKFDYFVMEFGNH